MPTTEDYFGPRPPPNEWLEAEGITYEELADAFHRNGVTPEQYHDHYAIKGRGPNDWPTFWMRREPDGTLNAGLDPVDSAMPTTDDALLAAVLRRFILESDTRSDFVSIGKNHIVLDGAMNVTDEEHAALLGVLDVNNDSPTERLRP